MRPIFLLVLVLFNCYSSRGQTKSTPHVRAAKTVIKSHKPDRIVIAAYGDTRTGPYGLGDNLHQQVHKVVVSNLLGNKGIDAVLFTGDAVMTNFPVWAKGYWKDFLRQSNRIPFDSGIPFFPSVGNHETYTHMPALQIANVTASIAALDGGNPTLQTAISQIPSVYDAGEESVSQNRDFATTKVDPNSESGQRAITQWQRELQEGTPEERIQAAWRYGQFEGSVQKQFFALSGKDKCDKDGRMLQKYYVDLAHYDYLRQPIGDIHSYYAKVIEAEGFRIKLIALDTNCLDSAAQLTFFQNQLVNFDGKVIVFGHHPPVSDDLKGAMPWDAPPNWQAYRSYFSNEEGKKIVLWVFGHVHDYQRRSDVSGSEVSAPALVIAGGGGASLDSQPGTYQWQPDSWTKQFKTESQYSYLLVSITAKSLAVDAYGSRNPERPFKQMDHFTVNF